MPEPATLADRLRRLIESQGPIPVSHYMALANAHYYSTRDPLGAAGDFVTAPEISQMFGELVGLALADVWDRAGRPADPLYVELGPGRGTLAADALRAMRRAGLEPQVHLIETSPVLRAAQKERVAGASWHDSLDTVPSRGPVLAVANEFLDALPAHQLVAGEEGWCERLVGVEGDRFVPVLGGSFPSSVPPAPPGTLFEASPASMLVVQLLSHRLAAGGGAALIIDYGRERTGFGETLQAVSRHGHADPWSDPGERDLTVHVDFEALKQAALYGKARAYGPVDQGAWLRRLGIDARVDALARAEPGRAAEIEGARDRLTLPDQMGTLFKVLALASPHWPVPAGFE